MKTFRLNTYIKDFNRQFTNVTGKEPKSDAWVWAHILGTVLSDWSESALSCGWCEAAIIDRMKRALLDASISLSYPGGLDALDSHMFATLYRRAGCMVTLSDDGAHYMPVVLKD